MTEQETIMKFIDKPYSLLNRYLLSKKFLPSQAQRDAVHKLNKVIFKLHDHANHLKVTVWHMWLDPDQYGISRPGCVTDIEYKDLDPKDEYNNVRNG